MTVLGESRHPQLIAAIDTLGRIWPNLRDAVEALVRDQGRPYADDAEQQLRRLSESLLSRGSSIDDALDGYVEMTVDTLRLQAEFFRTGRFSYLDESPGDELHHDASLMLGRYLPGLFLAGLFWPNHWQKLEYFRQGFLPLLPERARVLDVGTGPGSFGLRCLDLGCEVTFNDLSPHSQVFVESLAGEPLDFRVGSFLDLGLGQFDGIVFSEIVEHLPDPRAGMKMLRTLCGDDTVIFFSTATNAAFYDHTLVFDSIDDILGLLDDFGFVVVTHDEVLAAKGPAGRDVVDFNAVLRRDAG